MPTKVAIQQEKDFAANMAQLMEIMKGLALSSYVKLKKTKEKRFEGFIHSFDGFFHITDLSKAKSPFIQPPSETLGVVLVTSEESFMSGLNSKVVRLGLEMAGNKSCEFMVTGKKGGSRLKMEGKLFTVFPALKEKDFYSVAVKIKDHIVQRIQEKQLGPVIGIFADPVSFSTQRATAVHFLPAHDVGIELLGQGHVFFPMCFDQLTGILTLTDVKIDLGQAVHEGAHNPIVVLGDVM